MCIRKKRINNIWKQEFCGFLKLLSDTNSIEYKNFCEQYYWHDSTIRYWLCGKRLPCHKAFEDLTKYLFDNLNDNLISSSQITDKVKTVLSKNKCVKYYNTLKRKYPNPKEFALETLVAFYCFANNDFSLVEIGENEIEPSGFIRAVIFDFDGTLTSSDTNKTTWEMLWTSLGYDIKMCQQLHDRFNKKEISHEEWCDLTREKFCDRRLHKELLYQIASKIELIDGIEETFKILEENNIKIYIVSGSIDVIIKCVLGELYKYIDVTKSNIFRFNKNGYLTEIIGTKYDFEGKADFITEMATELNVSPYDVLFVGNSINDRFAYESGAQTLCINPKLTDTANQSIWNNCIVTCNNLKEILKYIKMDI